MRAVGIKTLKNKLSEYVRLAAGGETVLVTDRDRVVAELGPPRPGRAEVLEDARLAEAVRHAWIRPPAEGSDEAPPSKPWGTRAEILEDLDWSRQDRE
jgi:antitoxin (DNA-binding transcriptional repressor) of toxin-antitoxin stability system